MLRWRPELARITPLVLILCFVFKVSPTRAQDTTTLPQGQVGKVYSVTIGLDTENGKGQFLWRLAHGDLPPGLQLVTSGKIEGTPTAAKTDPYLFDLTVSDSSQPPQSAVLRFSLVIAAAPLRIKAVNVATTQLKVLGVSAAEAGPGVTAPTGAVPEVRATPNAVTAAPGSAATPVVTPGPDPPTGAQDPPNCQTTTVPSVSGTPVARLRVITGCAGTTHSFVELHVYKKDSVASCSAASDADKLTSTRAWVDPKTGVFHAELQKAVDTGEVICIWGVKSDNSRDLENSSLPVSVLEHTFEESSSEHGRIRYYFTGGVILSQENQQFSKQSLNLGFNLDKNWARHNWAHGSLLVNTYFDAQLTSIPVAANCESVTAPGGTGTGTGSCSQTNDLQTFMTSRKAAVVQGGLYFPIYLNQWKWWYGGNENAVFLAPIAKGGIQTLMDGTQSISSPTPGVTTTTTTQSDQNLFPFYAYGIRLGHFTNYTSWNIAPELNSYLDLTIGRWNNFTQCQNGTCALSGKQFFQPTTIDIEGRMKFPKTPFQIGFSTFTPITGSSLKGDLRFFFGVQLDVGCIMNKIIAGQNTTFTGCGADQGAAQAKNANP